MKQENIDLVKKVSELIEKVGKLERELKLELNEGMEKLKRELKLELNEKTRNLERELKKLNEKMEKLESKLNERIETLESKVSFITWAFEASVEAEGKAYNERKKLVDLSQPVGARGTGINATGWIPTREF